MITLTNNTKGLALLPQVEEIYGKVHTSDSLLETVLYWRINCTVNSKKIVIESFIFVKLSASAKTLAK